MPQNPAAMTVETWSLDRVKPYERNPRKIPEKAVDKVCMSLREYGWRQPLVVDPNGVLIVGHTRRLAALKLDWIYAPVHVAHDLTAKQIAAYRLMDNRSHQESEWDLDSLTLELQDLKSLDLDLELTGFDEDELAGFLDEPFTGLTDEDSVPAVPDEPVTAAGDVWSLGRHRLLAGDARKPGDVAKLIGDAKINVVVTSPPYADRRDFDKDSGFKPIPPDEYTEWYKPVAESISSILAPDGSYFLNMKEHSEDGERSLYVKDLLLTHKRQWGWRFVDEFCWRKTDDGVPGRWENRFKNAWEPIYHFCLQSEIKFMPYAVGHESDDCFDYSPNNPAGVNTAAGFSNTRYSLNAPNGRHAGLARPSNVLECRAENLQGSHSAPFPIVIPTFFLKAFSDEEDAVYDPFAGAGTVLIAAEKLNRVGYAMEISPRYCDVIVQRWQEFTGEDAVLDGDGRSFNHIRNERMSKAEALV